MVIGERKIPGEMVRVCGVCEKSWGNRRKQVERRRKSKKGGREAASWELRNLKFQVEKGESKRNGYTHPAPN